jgi:hypothetical protein
MGCGRIVWPISKYYLGLYQGDIPEVYFQNFPGRNKEKYEEKKTPNYWSQSRFSKCDLQKWVSAGFLTKREGAGTFTGWAGGSQNILFQIYLVVV